MDNHGREVERVQAWGDDVRPTQGHEICRGELEAVVLLTLTTGSLGSSSTKHSCFAATPAKSMVTLSRLRRKYLVGLGLPESAPDDREDGIGRRHRVLPPCSGVRSAPPTKSLPSSRSAHVPNRVHVVARGLDTGLRGRVHGRQGAGSHRRVASSCLAIRAAARPLPRGPDTRSSRSCLRFAGAAWLESLVTSDGPKLGDVNAIGDPGNSLARTL